MGSPAAFRPDIIVVPPEEFSRPEVVVEVRLFPENYAELQKDLVAYMVAMRCPLGVIVTPDRLWLYIDRYLSPGADSIEQLGPYSLGDTFQVAAKSGSESLLADHVQRWLDRLASGNIRDVLPAQTAAALQTHLIPALVNGVVRAARLRWPVDSK